MGFFSFRRRNKAAALPRVAKPDDASPCKASNGAAVLSREVSDESSEEHAPSVCTLREIVLRLSTAHDEPCRELLGPESMVALCGELGFGDTSFRALTLLRLCGASEPGAVSVSALLSLAASKTELVDLLARAEASALACPIVFSEVATFAFRLALDRGAKCLPLETATVLLSALASPLCADDRARTELFCTFVRAADGLKALNRDQFVSWFAFLAEVRERGLEGWTEGDAFPLLFDDFVAFARARV